MTGKELTKKALELRSDLEGSASDVSTLYTKIGSVFVSCSNYLVFSKVLLPKKKELISARSSSTEHKNYLEEKNRQQIQNFYSQLVQLLQELDEGVSASATSQEQNLKAIQDNTQSFLTSKAKVS